MRVLHAPINTAGQPAIISKAQRKLGIISDVLVFSKGPYNYECDFCLNIKKYPKFLWPFLMFIAFLRVLPNYDIFHFHFAKSLLPYNLDIPLLKLFGKKIVMQYWGSDIFQSDLAKEYFLLTDEDVKKVYGNLDDDNKRTKINHINQIVDLSIVGDYSLAPFSPGSIVVRQAIELSRFPFVGSVSKDNSVTIVHAPTNRDIKGTTVITSAIERLKKEGEKINFVLVGGVSHAEVIEIYKTADIIVDDVKQGPYGILAIECMALGKPVLVYINEHFKKYYRGLPIINTSPDSIYDNLKKLINNPKLREKLGVQGRAYVEQNHDSKVIAKQLIEIYKKL